MKNPYINKNVGNIKADVNMQVNSKASQDKGFGTLGSNLPFNTNNFNSFDFVKGLAVGAIGAYLLTNKNAQETLFRALIKGGTLLSAGFEELKERFEDVKAQVQSEQ